MNRSAKPTAKSIADPKSAIRDLALSLGFDAVGFAGPESGETARQLGDYLADGYHGDMGWMETTRERRQTPRGLWPDVKSIVSVAMNYGPEEDPLLLHAHPDRATVSTYARGRDYHDVLKKRLRQLARAIAEDWGCEVKLFVDTAPVMEKPAAQRAGLGWQGKHTNLVSRGFGSWVFLGEVFTTLDLTPDTAETDHCGGCRNCLDICPTAAFPEPYKLDARRCISYLTIEHSGHIPHEFREPMGNRIYGCDDCLAVCPWNKFARTTPHQDLRPHIHLKRPRLKDFAMLDDAGFRQVFSGSPVKRLGRDRFIRNVLIAVGNSGDDSLIDSAKNLLGDASPLVRAMAVWALSRLLAPASFLALKTEYAATEPDFDVRAEWDVENPYSDTA
jgi:epoxyqueuosine reductase